MRRFIAIIAALFISTPALAQQSTAFVVWDGLEQPDYILELPGDPGQNTINFEVHDNQKLVLDYQGKRFCSMIEDRLLFQENSDEDYFPEDPCTYFLAYQIHKDFGPDWLIEELSRFEPTKIIRPNDQAVYLVKSYEWSQPPPPPPPEVVDQDQDQDEDGIIDREDVCPHQLGVDQFRGCPRDDPAATGVILLGSDPAVKASIYFLDGTLACDNCQDVQLNPERKIVFTLPVGKYLIKTEKECHREVIIFQERGPSNPLSVTMNGSHCSQYTYLEADEVSPSPLPPPPPAPTKKLSFWEKQQRIYGGFAHGPHLGYRFTRGNYSVGPSSPPSRQDTILVGYGIEYLFLEFQVSGFLGRDRYMINPRFSGYQFQGKYNFHNMCWLGLGWMRELQGLGSPTGFRYSHDGYLFSFEMAPWRIWTNSDLLEVPRLGLGLNKAHGWLPNDSGKVEWRNVTYGYVYVIIDASIFPR